MSRLQKNPCLLSVILDVNDCAFQSLSEQKNPIDINDLMLFPVNTTEDVAETTVLE